MKKEEFIKIQLDLLNRKDITPTEKLVIAYLKSLQSNNNYHYAGVPSLAECLGMKKDNLNKVITKLEDKKIIFKSSDKKYIQKRYNQRMAIVLVDNNNPYPTNNTPKVKSNKEKTKSNTNTPKEEKEFVREEISYKLFGKELSIPKYMKEDFEKYILNRNTILKQALRKSDVIREDYLNEKIEEIKNR